MPAFLPAAVSASAAMNVWAMPVAHAVTATMRAGRPSTLSPSATAAVAGAAVAAGGRRGGGSGIPLADRVAHDRDDLVGARRGAQAAREVVLHEAAGELREHGEVRLGGTLGGRDEEHEVGGSVGSAEVDTGLKSRERERRRDDGRALRVRNRDAAGQARLVLLLAGPGVIEEPFGVGGTALLRNARCEGSDHRRLVGAEGGVERHQLWRDGLRHDDLQWSVMRWCVVGDEDRCSWSVDGRSGEE